MNRRNFLSTLIGGVVTAAAVRTFPFRVFSFPTQLTGNWEGLHIDPFPGVLTTPKLFAGPHGWGLNAIPYRVNPYLPVNEIWLIREPKVQALHLHEGPRAGQDIREVIEPGQILRIIDLKPVEGKEPLLTSLRCGIL
jgi:hypothetical protein